jgi:hypothetical protein
MGKKEINKTFRSDEEFTDFLARIESETGLGIADLVRIAIPLALPQIKSILKSQSSSEAGKLFILSIARSMLDSQQD